MLMMLASKSPDWPIMLANSIGVWLSISRESGSLAIGFSTPGITSMNLSPKRPSVLMVAFASGLILLIPSLLIFILTIITLSQTGFGVNSMSVTAPILTPDSLTAAPFIRPAVFVKDVVRV